MESYVPTQTNWESPNLPALFSHLDRPFVQPFPSSLEEFLLGGHDKSTYK